MVFPRSNLTLTLLRSKIRRRTPSHRGPFLSLQVVVVTVLLLQCSLLLLCCCRFYLLVAIVAPLATAGSLIILFTTSLTTTLDTSNMYISTLKENRNAKQEERFNLYNAITTSQAPGLAARSIRVRLRQPINHPGAADMYRCIDVDLSNVAPEERLQRVQDAVIDELQPEWDKLHREYPSDVREVRLARENIVLIQEGENGPVLVGNDDLNETLWGPMPQPAVAVVNDDSQESKQDESQDLKESAEEKSQATAKKNQAKKKQEPEPQRERVTFRAREIFEGVLPFTCSRTQMKIEVNKGLVCTHPDVLSLLQRFSSLHCGAFTVEELELPWYEGGLSVFIRLPNEKYSKCEFDPFNEPVKQDETKRVYFNSLEEYAEQITDKSKEAIVEGLGILGQAFQAGKQGRIKGFKSPGKKFATSRHAFFRFLLWCGTRLPRYFAFVFDNSDLKTANHGSVVIRKEGIFKRWDYTSPTLGGTRSPVKFPNDQAEALEQLMRSTEGDLTNEGFKDFLRSIYNDSEDDGPVFDDLSGYVAFPKLSALFSLFDIKVEASAEPQWLKEDKDPEVEKIFTAAKLIYHSDPEWGVILSIGELEEAGYLVSELDASSSSVLLKTLQEGFDLEEAANALRLDVDEASDCVDALQEALEALLGDPVDQASGSLDKGSDEQAAHDPMDTDVTGTAKI